MPRGRRAAARAQLRPGFPLRPNEARYFAGFVGWSPGELASEIARGLWFVTEPDASLVFRNNTSGMWQELVKRLGNSRPPLRGRGQLEARLEAGPA